MEKTITIPAGTKIKTVGMDFYIRIDKEYTVSANWRADDDKWVFTYIDGYLYEVNLSPGD